jgi:CRP-like cAMP-binding protein
LRPETFVYALRETFLQVLEEDPAGRNAILTQAAGLLGLSLRQLYKELVDWLRTAGIEPAAQPLVGSSELGGVGGGSGAPPAVARTMLTLDKLRRLLSGELSEPAPGARTHEFSQTLPAAYNALEDMKLLEHMMKRLAERTHQAPSQLENPEANGTAAATTAVSGQEKATTKRLGAQLGEEVVRLMVDNLEQDYRLLAPVRASLRALEPVLQKLVQTDARFFSERTHPARQYLDRITNRSLAFSSLEQPGLARFMKTFDNANSVLAVMRRRLRSSFRRLEAAGRDEHEQRQRAERAARALLHAEQRHRAAPGAGLHGARGKQGRSRSGGQFPAWPLGPGGSRVAAALCFRHRGR